MAPSPLQFEYAVARVSFGRKPSAEKPFLSARLHGRLAILFFATTKTRRRREIDKGVAAAERLQRYHVFGCGSAPMKRYFSKHVDDVSRMVSGKNGIRKKQKTCTCAVDKHSVTST